MSDSLQPFGLYLTRLLSPLDSPGQNTGVDCRALLQGIFPIQGSNPHLLRILHWQAGSLPQNRLGSSLLLSSRGSLRSDLLMAMELGSPSGAAAD